RIEEFGDASANKQLNESFEDDFRRAEVTSLPITLLILLLAFAAVVAALVPLLLAATAVAAAIGLLGPLSRAWPIDDSVTSVVLLVGLAVGVDYSMFYLRRKLEERDRGSSSEAALETAAATSGRAVLISGMTVIVAMAGMFLAGNAVFTSFAVGTITVVAVAMLGSVTVLPALLATLGDRVEWGRVPFIARGRHRGEPRIWGAVLDRVLRRPALSLSLGAGLLLAAAIPAIWMHTMSPGASGLPRHLPIVQTYDRMQAAFPGGPLPAAIVVHADDVTTPAITNGIAGMIERARAGGRITGPDSVTVSPDKTVAVVTLPLPGNGTDAVSDAALAELRTEVVPATIDRVAGTETNITGLTAASRDFNDVMKARLPIVVAFVLGLAFVLLLRVFHSLVIPVTAIALNLLSVAAAYGVVKLIFQDGNLESILGFESLGGVISWLPLFLFVVLFGLSMDYHVLILSRVQEAVDDGMPTDRAVSHAIKATAGVVTSAAVVMVAVFSIFATLGAIEFKQFGVALGVAVLVDATIVRAVLLPSAMTLLGHRNWYLPRWLEWAAGRHTPPIAASGRSPEPTTQTGDGRLEPPASPISPPAAPPNAPADRAPSSKKVTVR
ncbi:MAG TPA: MMPL family transporter, partial [Gemmatimonadaceae bacterium]|nr:MMPL family transporter [Gemmatimonadaceae bacterium]